MVFSVRCGISSSAAASYFRVEGIGSGGQRRTPQNGRTVEGAGQRQSRGPRSQVILRREGKPRDRNERDRDLLLPQERSQGGTAVQIGRGRHDPHAAASPAESAQQIRQDGPAPLPDPAQKIQIGVGKREERDSPVGRAGYGGVRAVLDRSKRFGENGGGGSDVATHQDGVPAKRGGPARGILEAETEGAASLPDPGRIRRSAENLPPRGNVFGRCGHDELRVRLSRCFQPASRESPEELGCRRSKPLFARLARWLPGKEDQETAHPPLSYVSVPRRGLLRSRSAKGKTGDRLPDQRFRSMNLMNSLLGIAPRTRSATCPFLNRMNVGMEVT